LETALYEVPQVVCYKGSYVSYLVAKSIVKINYISLVNLIMDYELVKELIQGDLNVENLHKHLLKIMPNTAGSVAQKQGYKELKQELGGIGASKRAAQRILELF
jgi:lipid-A-disaccharide synthase